MILTQVFFKGLLNRLWFGRSLAKVPAGSLVFFPLSSTTLHCGIAGLIAYKKGIKKADPPSSETDVDAVVARIRKTFEAIPCSDLRVLKGENSGDFLGGEGFLEKMAEDVTLLHTELAIVRLFSDETLRKDLGETCRIMGDLAKEQSAVLMDRQTHFSQKNLVQLKIRLEKLQDIHWHISRDLLVNLEKTRVLTANKPALASPGILPVFHQTQTVLSSIELLEVRGRDSAGISLFFILDSETMALFHRLVEKEGLTAQLTARSNPKILVNEAVSIQTQGHKERERVSIVFTYKVAKAIGSLGDNGAFLRSQIKNDTLLHLLSTLPHHHFSVAAHTRWASLGEISEANCHPVDNQTEDSKAVQSGIIQVALNGDIDNYQDLKQRYENHWDTIPAAISTDTKIIPLQVAHYLKSGHGIEEAFRRAVSDFDGSHAIWMQTDLAPGKLFLAQKGSGQTIFVGIGQDYYLAASEVYGFVESTPHYIKMEGEKTVEGLDGPTQGQIFILDENTKNPVKDIKALYYDGTPFPINDDLVKRTDITSRDIDRQDYPHYFLKEISESPNSVTQTLAGRVRIEDTEEGRYPIDLEPETVPESLKQEFCTGKIRKIFFIGQGTASIAAQVSADLLRHYLKDPSVQIQALKASELSGFFLDETDGPDAMKDCLVVAISQSGTTTDTNLSVDLVRDRGARTLGIVNRRDSDLTFKVDGVLYTSSGRDIEMSVASTKAFYSQIVAGALLGLYLTKIRGKRTADFIDSEIRELVALPNKMEKVLSLKESIGEKAKKLALSRTYWATVGSGPNKSAADEVRIKLSELCYRTLSSDYVEDKKHIDLSAEPLIFICAAGTRPTVMGDILKDTKIFYSHKALPVVVVTEGDQCFNPYAEQIIAVPELPEHLAPLLNTLAGHIWGYYAALGIDRASHFFFEQHRRIEAIVQKFQNKDLDIHAIVQEEEFREEVARFGTLFRKALSKGLLTFLLDARAATDILLLSHCLSGRLPIAESEIDGEQDEKSLTLLDLFLKKLKQASLLLSRPVDAIKHQAKTVTVGTSRISEKVEGLLFDALAAHGVKISQLKSHNILVLRNLQAVISKLNGAFLYKIQGLNLLGEATGQTTISLIQKTGTLADMSSRVETDPILKGSKRIIVHEGNVFIGQGKKDTRSLLIIPAFSNTSEGSRVVEYLLSCDVSFHDSVPLFARMKALGGKHDRIRNNVNEYSVVWKDAFLDLFSTAELFGFSADKIVEEILKRRKSSANSRKI